VDWKGRDGRPIERSSDDAGAVRRALLRVPPAHQQAGEAGRAGDAWNRWADQADYDRHHDAYGLQALAFRFEQQVTGQVRGVSWLAPVLLSLRDLGDFNRATVVKQKVAALLTGFITMPNDNPLAATQAADGAWTASLEPGTLF
jgi:capsid protein